MTPVQLRYEAALQVFIARRVKDKRERKRLEALAVQLKLQAEGLERNGWTPGSRAFATR